MKLPQLRKWREEAALSQRQLAAKARVTHATISHIETGGDAYPTTAAKLAAALGVKPVDLMTPTPSQQS